MAAPCDFSALDSSSPRVCPLCFNLDISRCPAKPADLPLLLDDYRFSIPFSDLKLSGEKRDCIACQILLFGLERTEEAWEDRILLEETLLVIHLRRGHSLRVTLANTNYEITIEFYTVSIDDCGGFPAFGVASHVPSKSNLKDSLALAKVWMKDCTEKHSSCKPTADSRLPSRVLDLGNDADTDIILLRETQDYERGLYMSLSHCWGKEQIITTTTESLRDRKAGIHISELSETFRQAVKITQGLGIRYLWIDSLCIIQNDEADWKAESARMADIYMNSQLNIAATHSRNGKGGCLGERWSLDTSNQTELIVDEDEAIVPSEGEEGNYKVFYRHALHVAHDQFTRTMDYANTMEEVSPLLSRAWVFQERLLSLRTLHFHAEELIWECASGISCECSRLQNHKWGDPDGLLEQQQVDQLKMMYTSITSPETTDLQVLDIWQELVSEYCTLKLSNQLDRLPALSGLASRVAQRLPSSTYLAGLWSQDLPRALCWQIDGAYKNTSPSYRDPQSNAPSWSWASVWTYSNDAPSATYGLVQTRGFTADARCQIQSTHYSPGALNLFAGCEDARLNIRAPFIEATTRVSEIDKTVLLEEMRNGNAHQQSLVEYMELLDGFRNEVIFDGESIMVSPDYVDTQQRMTGINSGESIGCLLLGHFEQSEGNALGKYPSQYLTSEQKIQSEDKSDQKLGTYALLVRKVHNGPTFERLGLLVRREGSGWWDNAEVIEMTLV